jgi:hypothetical protein
MSDDKLVRSRERSNRSDGGPDIRLLGLCIRRLTALQQSVTAKSYDEAHGLHPQGRDQDSLDRVHAVLRLHEDDGRR